MLGVVSDPNPGANHQDASRRAVRFVKRRPDSIDKLERRINEIATAGLDGFGVTSAEPFTDAAQAIGHRVRNGLDAGLPFTFRNPDVATQPRRGLREAQAVVVGAVSYRVAASEPGDDRPRGRVAAYARRDFYGALKGPLGAIAAEIRSHGYRARMVVDDNALVDRAAAVRAGLGWFGKNSNVLLPGKGSWFVLGGVLTTAPLTPTESGNFDGCGPCVRCIPACPTNAIPEPGVIDANKCLAWIVQRAGVIPIEYRSAIGTRLYGCDDCQDVCPDNRKADRDNSMAAASADDLDHIDLLEMLNGDDHFLLSTFGRWYIPDRDPAHLRRNLLIALGNAVNSRYLAEARTCISRALVDERVEVRIHAAWAAGQWALEDDLRHCLSTEVDEAVRQELHQALNTVPRS